MSYIQSLNEKNKTTEELTTTLVKERGCSKTATEDTKEDEIVINVITQVQLPHGLIGLEQYTQFSLEQYKHNPIVILRSTEVDDLLFYLVNPYEVRKDYALVLQDYDYEVLHITDKKEHVFVYVILTLHKELQHITCNLLGPILINPDNDIGKQCINNGWGTKHLLETGEEVIS